MIRINSKIYFDVMASRSMGSRVIIRNANGFLFNGNRHLTKVTFNDLPYGYIRCKHGDFGGYLCTKGIKGLKYVPGNTDNLAEDKLYISYGKYKPSKAKYDVVVFGNEITVALYGANMYSDYDINYIYKKIRPKLGKECQGFSCKNFINSFDKVYGSLPDYYDDRVMMAFSKANKLPDKENTIFNYPANNLFIGDVKGSAEKRTKEELNAEMRKCFVPYWKK